MRGKRRSVPESEFTDAELDLYGEFSEAVRDGKNPDIEEYLRRLPESADKLRPDLEAVVVVSAEIKKLAAVYSPEELVRMLDPKHRLKRE